MKKAVTCGIALMGKGDRIQKGSRLDGTKPRLGTCQWDVDVGSCMRGLEMSWVLFGGGQCLQWPAWSWSCVGRWLDVRLGFEIWRGRGVVWCKVSWETKDVGLPERTALDSMIFLSTVVANK